MRRNRKVFITILVLLLGCLLCGCGIKQKSPEGVVKSLFEAYAKGKQANAIRCYGMKEKEADVVTKEETAANISYFKVHKAKKIELEKCDVITRFDGYSYVYIMYCFKLEDDKSYPAISTYLVEKKGKKYCVMPSKDIGEDLVQKVQKAYEEFMKSEDYKEYTKRYDAFMTTHPGYEEKIAEELKK